MRCAAYVPVAGTNGWERCRNWAQEKQILCNAHGDAYAGITLGLLEKRFEKEREEDGALSGRASRRNGHRVRGGSVFPGGAAEDQERVCGRDERGRKQAAGGRAECDQKTVGHETAKPEAGDKVREAERAEKPD